MADQATSPAIAAAPKPDEAAAPAAEMKPTTVDAPTEDAAADKKDETKAEGSAEAKPVPDEPATSTTEDQPASEKNGDNNEDKETGVEAGEEASANGTPKTNGRRKSTGGGPASAKKLNKKKSIANINLNVKPGEYWWARMKGYAAWPVIICDEAMLPESLLTKRPVSAIRPDGTYREDFADGGKNARDRRYPVMFLGTNEFAWQVNTELTPLDMDEVKKVVENNEQGKKTKALWEAWKVTSENNSLEYFKTLLMEHEKAMAEDAEERAAKEAEKAEKAEKVEKAEKGAKKTKRKTKGGENEDVEMEDVVDGSDSAGKKAAKRRKKEGTTEAEGEKPVKTPKTKLKVNGPKTPADATPKTKKTPATKAKNSKKSESESATPKAVEPELTPEQKFEQRSKNILYLRHRLQKGFLTRDQPPKEEEMQTMAGYFTQLEANQELEEKIIKETKINKVLKAIIKLDSIPKEEVYNFKKRSTDLLNIWAKNLGREAKVNGVDSKEGTAEAKSPAEKTPAATEEPKAEEPKVEEPKAQEESKDVEMRDAEDASAEPKPDAKGADGDVAMEDAKPADKPAADSAEGAKEETTKVEDKLAEKPTEEATAAA